MTYQLPEPEYLGWDYECLLVKPIRGYTADQMQAAWQAGRDSMKVECVKAVDEQDDLTPLDWMLLRTGSRSLK